MNKLLLTLMAAGSAIVVSSGAQAQNLVVNGDFEQGTNPQGGPVGWTVIPGREIKPITGSAYQANAGATGSAAALANTYAAFGSGNAANRSSLVSAAFGTVAGQLYRLVFSYAQFGGTPGQEALDYDVFDDSSVSLLSGTKVTTAANTGTDLDTIFTTYRYNYFVGTGDLAHVSFSISGTPTINVDGLLDNVVITAVPESGTWALLIVGMAGTGLMLRRRRGARTTTVRFA